MVDFRDQIVEENDTIMSIQMRQLSEFAELRRNGASELIRVEVPFESDSDE